MGGGLSSWPSSHQAGQWIKTMVNRWIGESINVRNVRKLWNLTCESDWRYTLNDIEHLNWTSNSNQFKICWISNSNRLNDWKSNYSKLIGTSVDHMLILIIEHLLNIWFKSIEHLLNMFHFFRTSDWKPIEHVFNI